MLGWDDDDDWDTPVLERMIYGENFVRFDPNTRTWICKCPGFARTGRCPHVRLFKKRETLRILEEYL